MGSTFNPQILMEKLMKLNMSQQSIETLSHWCIFHMNKAKFVVDTWARQFHNSPRDQRLAFLYLANDILQNSRRKGVEFVAEFWRVLPDAVRDVIQNGDDAGRNAVRRLISIWDERKVFGSHGHILKGEFVGKQPENSSRSGKQPTLKSRPVGNVLDKVVSEYGILYDAELNEDTLISRCTSTISALKKLVHDFDPGVNSGKFNGPGSTEELRGQQASLKECIDQLTALESSRASLVSHLRDFLQDQELKLDRVRSQLQAAQSQSDQVSNICGKSINSGNTQLNEQDSSMPPGFTRGESQSPPIVYTRQPPVSNNKAALSDDDSRKSTAADVAAKLSASTSSAEMLSHAFTSLVSGVTFTNSSSNNLSGAHESPSDRQLEKRPKLEEDPSFHPSPPPLPPSPPPPLPTSQQVTPGEQPPPPPSSPPPPPPLPPMMPPYPMPPQFIQTAGPMSNVTYTYGVVPQPPPPYNGPGYPSVGPPMMGMPPYGHPVNPFQNYQIPENGIYNPSSAPMAPMPHQQRL